MVGPGVRLGSYDILSPLGAGGMGEVFRARDSKLGRDVAIKVLPSTLASDPDRIARFQREAQVLASLNHPHIGAIYGLEEADGVRALVLELVEGETLADRIARGPLPVDEALSIAKQIADALESAHEQGVIHRDLKPANIKVDPNGRVKVLDFGLAKLAEPLAASSHPSALSMSPTITSPAMTQLGMILGTAAYMSPEQAKGRPADKRSDVWAFGCVLFEMLSGKKAFAGADVAETLAAILKDEPDWASLPRGLGAKVTAVLRRCLAKNRKDRYGDVGDVRWDLSQRDDTATDAPSRAPRWVWIGAAGLAAALIATSVVTVRHLSESVDAPSPIEFEIGAPESTNGLGDPEVSPDGRTVAFVAPGGGMRTIWVRPLNSTTATRLPGTDADRFFWSPDSQSIAYASNFELKRVSVNGGPPRTVTALPERAYDGTWSADGTMLLGATSTGGGLLRVLPSGGAPVRETTPDDARGERFHTLPRFLPDGQHYFFVAVGSKTATYVGLLGSADRTVLPDVGSEVHYSQTGHIVFLRQGALMGQRFDLDRLALVGEAFLIEDAIAPANVIYAAFSLNQHGTLAFRNSAERVRSRLVWLDAMGNHVGDAAPDGTYVNPELSPDERFVAFDDGSGTAGDIRLLELRTGLIRRVTSHPALEGLPQFSADSKQLLFRSDRGKFGDLYVRDIDGVGDDTLVWKSGATKTPYDWSPDGRYVLYVEEEDVWALPMFGDRKPFRVTETPGVELNPRISLNGKWIAYQALPEGDSSPGASEIFIQSFPEPRIKRQVSVGGLVPRWSRTGNELFYKTLNRELMSVRLTETTSGLVVQPPMRRFNIEGTPTLRNYSVSKTGRFLVRGAVEGQRVSPIKVIVNWAQNVDAR